MDIIELRKEALSAREFEVLELLTRERKNREIALVLEIEECTVRFHVGRILDKLKVQNRTESVYYTFTKGGSGIDLLIIALFRYDRECNQN